MILMGTLPDVDYDARHHRIVEIKVGRPRRNGPREVIVEISVDTSNFERYIVQTARNMTTLDVLLEVIGLTVDQVWATFYVRGSFHPDFAEASGRDNYLRSLLKIRGDRGRAAVEGFLRGWAEHHSTPGEPFVWHRYIGGVEWRVSSS